MVFRIAKQVVVGVSCGIGQQLITYYSTGKICDLTGMKIEETDSFKAFTGSVSNYPRVNISGPIAEECVCRGVLEPMVTQLFSSDFPKQTSLFFAKIPPQNMAAVILVGTAFGILHKDNYKSGAAFATGVNIVQGVGYGLLYEKFGLMAAIFAHMANNISATIIRTVEGRL